MTGTTAGQVILVVLALHVSATLATIYLNENFDGKRT
jgi:hypothetical protein